MTGPLAGVRVVELAGIGPAPFAAMLLADMGAEVVRVDRVRSVPQAPLPPPTWDVPLRGRRSIAVDLQHRDGVSLLLQLVQGADALLEGFRPGVVERLGIGPQICLERNPRLVYGRVTGWGQEGPYAQAAGHDLNYIALAGALAHLGRAGQPPTPPLNLLGDYAGGAMFLVFGMACALFEAKSSGLGQVVDAAMVDGVASLMAMWWGFSQVGRFDEHNRGGHYFDIGAHFFEVYECADGTYVSIAAVEPLFYAELLSLLGLAEDPLFEVQRDPAAWPEQKARLAEVFRGRSQAEWCDLLEGTDACFAPVLTMSEAARHPHNVARGTFVEVDGIRQPSPAPRFSRTVPTLQRPPSVAGLHTRAVLRDWGVDDAHVDELLRAGVVAGTSGVPAP